LEKPDIALIQKHRKTNYDLDRLYDRHLQLEEEIAKIESIRVLTAAEEKKIHELKKTKLEGREKLEKILKPLR